jgi:hypothetical protein
MTTQGKEKQQGQPWSVREAERTGSSRRTRCIPLHFEISALQEPIASMRYLRLNLRLNLAPLGIMTRQRGWDDMYACSMDENRVYHTNYQYNEQDK